MHDSTKTLNVKQAFNVSKNIAVFHSDIFHLIAVVKKVASAWDLSIIRLVY